MKQKVMNHIKNNWQEYASFISMIVLIVLGLIYAFNLNNFDFNYPLAYYGGDDMGGLQNAKLFAEQGWMLSTDRMGAPYSSDIYDFSSSLLHNFGLMIMKLCVLITGNYIVGFNIYYLSIFVLAGIVSYIVMRQLKINNWVTAAMSAVYGLSPYMIARGVGHMVLVEAYFIPLSFLLCFWVMEREDVFQFNKNFFKTPANYAVLIMAALIANNGIAYYPYFTCFILLVTGVSKSLKTKKAGGFLKSLAMAGCVCFFVVLALLPSKIYSIMNGPNEYAISRAGFVETEMYGLKIIMLFRPLSTHGISLFEKAIDIYDSNTTFLNENITEYLGIAAIAGFFILMFALFMNRESALKKRLGLLSELNVMLLLLGTTSGLGTIIAFLITDKIRGYNRISIFIEYCCLLGLTLILNSLVEKYKKINKKAVMSAVIAVVYVFGIISMWDASAGRTSIDTYKSIQAEFDSDDKFVKTIESEVSEGAMIYQLPYHGYPEGGFQNDMWDYHLLVGYLHSDKLKWSYGSVKGREGDSWNENIGDMSYENMVTELKKESFEGIYVDRRAYTEETLTELETTLEKSTGSKPLVSDNGNLSFFKF